MAQTITVWQQRSEGSQPRVWGTSGQDSRLESPLSHSVGTASSVTRLSPFPPCALTASHAPAMFWSRGTKITPCCQRETPRAPKTNRQGKELGRGTEPSLILIEGVRQGLSNELAHGQRDLNGARSESRKEHFRHRGITTAQVLGWR